MGGGLLAWILILLQTLFAHFVRVGRQTGNRSRFMFFLFGHCGPPPLPLSRPWDEYTVSGFSFSQLVEMIHTDFQRLPPSCSIIVLLVVQNAWKPYRIRFGTTVSMGETCLPLLLASCTKFFVRSQLWGSCLYLLIPRCYLSTKRHYLATRMLDTRC